MRNLYSANVDISSVDNLISGTLVPCKVISGTLSEGDSILERGTLLTIDPSTGMFNRSTGDAISGVLLLDIDASDKDECEGVPVACSGEFNQNVIEDVMGLQLTAQAVAEARKQQIYIEPMERYPEVF